MEPYLTSTSLIGRLRNHKDADAWNRFNNIYSGLIESWLRRHGVPVDVADDVRQEVLAKVFQEIPDFEHNGRVGAFRKWLRTVMYHRLRTIQRQGWRRGDEYRPDWSDVVEQLAEDDSAMTRLWDAEHDAYVLDYLLTMVATEFTDQTLQAFRRVVLKNEDVMTVAKDLNMTPNAVRIAQSRVLAALRRIGEWLIV